MQFLPPAARRPLGIVALAATVTSAGLLGACGGGGERPRGVLLVSIDSLRADHLSCYGYESETAPGVPTSPNVDSLLADQGALFTNCVSTTSWTLPAHMAMLSGLPNELHGVRDQSHQLHDSQELLAQSFQRAGWRTAGFWSGPNLHPWFGFDRGFELYRDCSTVEVATGDVFGDRTAAAFERVVDLHNRSHQGITGPQVVAEFERWFAGVEDDERFFAFLHFWDVHYDYTPPAEHDIFFPGYEGTVTGERFREFVLRRPVDWDDVRRLESLYDGEIHFTDHNVARVLELLRERGRFDDTLVVFTSDHGDEFLEHKSFGHKKTLYDEVLRVPLVLRWPAAIPAGARVDGQVSLIDVAPTILDYCGLPRGAAMWGRSLRGAIEGELEPRDVPLELTAIATGVYARGLRGEGFKVLHQPQRPPLVYDLRRDPDEKVPLHGAEVAPLVERAAGAWEELELEAQRYGRALSGELPPDLESDLRDQGYVGDDEDEHAPDDAAREDGNEGGVAAPPGGSD